MQDLEEEALRMHLKNIGLGFAGNLGTAIPALFGSIGQSGKRMPSYGDTGLGRKSVRYKQACC